MYLVCLVVWLALGVISFSQHSDQVRIVTTDDSSLINATQLDQSTKHHNQTSASSQDLITFKTEYKRIISSAEYYKLFAHQISKISLSQIVNTTHISNGKQICIDSQPCQFYYYIIKPQFNPQQLNSFDINPINNNNQNNIRNIFIVAGMHGNEFLGPTALLYAIKHLQQTSHTRIILFPLANPSGYDHNKRTTHPTNIDPNRDFPIQQYTKCYQSSSSLIIDHIYRKYHIDLTIALHNGQSQIAWTWGTMRQKVNSQTKDQPIYRDIGEWLKFVGGWNKNRKVRMEQFVIGTMNEVVYPVEGGFEDWAYAAEWYNASASTKPSRSCNYLKFPYNMTNGLVFLFQLGPFNVNQTQFGSQYGLKVNPNSKNQSNGYISRAIRMLSGIVKILNPRLSIKFTESHTLLKLIGCKKGYITNLTIMDKATKKVYLSLTNELQLEGNVNNKTIQPSKIKLDNQLTSRYTLQNLIDTSRALVVRYNLVCDLDWLNKGETIFGQKRQFNISQSVILSSLQTKFLTQNYYPSVRQAEQSFGYIQNNSSPQSRSDHLQEFIQNNFEYFVVVGILMIVLGAILFVVCVICKEIRKDRKQKNVKKLMQKLERVNHGEEISSTTSDEDISQDNLQQIKIAKQQLTKQSDKKEEISSYPHMCQSDKSIKTDELNSFGDIKI